MLAFSGLVLWKISVAKRHPDRVYIRPIAGLKAIDEAIGRAAELGTPILFNPGIEDFTNIQTLAALGVLGHVAKKCAQFSTPIIVTTCKPVMVAICEDVLRSAFDSAGRPDMMHVSEVRFISTQNDLAALGASALMVDRRVASVFLFGSYDYTSLLISEGGKIAGCMQIAATADYYQVPFFIASCDYVVMVEELFACSSYLSREPVMMGSVAGQDFGKLLLLSLLGIGVVLATIYGTGNPFNGYERLFSF
ncbi:MAG: hypothetical protein P4L46_03130 [Fimbriimonas sp.]|nr:hypothetical protein [Fimbriimonas sp.]